MTTPTPESIARLPKWTRDHIARLERRVEDAEREREEARLATDPANSSALLDPYADPPIGLGTDARVRFPLISDDFKGVDVHVVRDYVTGCLAIEIMGAEALTIRAQASNVIVVGLAR